MPRHLGAALPLALCVLGTACIGPRIDLFEVQPVVVCAGEKAAVRWSTNGETAMTMQLEVPPSRTLDRSALPEIFKLRLVVRKSGKEAVGEKELVQLPPTSVNPV